MASDPELHSQSMFNLVRRSIGALLFGAGALVSLAAGDFAIQNGDRVVFLGDSITEQRLYTTYIEAYALTRHPDWTLQFRNVGWGGDTSWLRQRAHPDEGRLFAAEPEAQAKMVEESVGRGLGRDVLPLHPTFVTVKFGMNDHSYQPFRADIFGAYVRSQAEIGKDLKAAGARVAFLTPQPIEERRADPDKDDRNVSLRKFSDGLKEVAQKSDSRYVDQFDPYLAIMMQERSRNASAFIGGGDAVHPGPAGQTIMAWAVLKGLDASALVSRAEIDATAGKVTTAEGCTVDHVNSGEGRVSFDRLDSALPMPVDQRAEAALALAPVIADLSDYSLKVSGLTAAVYELTIDGEAAGKVSKEELGKGWNLTLKGGPITQQSRKVLELVFHKNNLFFNRWRDVQLHGFPSWAAGPELELRRTQELARLDAEIEKVEREINATRKPVTHHFELKPANP